MAALDAPTQPRIARSRQRRCPAPPPRRALTGSAATVGVELPRTVQRVSPPVVPTSTLPRPSTRVEPEPRRSRRWIGVLVAALAGGLATGAALAVTGVGVGLLPTTKTGPTAAQALGAVQRLGAQQSAPRTVERTFTVNQTSFLDLGGRIRYHAVGQAQATVDLGAVGASDLQVRGSRATVRIPAAQLDQPAIDDTNSSFVNNRDRPLADLLDRGVTAGDVQPQAEQQLSDAAQAQGIPDAAQQLAIAQVRATLRRLGFASVAVSVAGA
jgi:hypothetical protein